MLSVSGLPAFTDNYIWAIHDAASAWVVDPGDASEVLAWLERNRLRLLGILLTHHHGDHIGGVRELLDAQPDLVVIGPRAGRDAGTMPWLTCAAVDGDTFRLAPWGLPVEVMETPGHTLDHICYFSEAHDRLDDPLLFCGDTLFAAGCGRLFEGTAEQMWDSLTRLAALPADTRVCCAHEYTLSNLRFAIHAEPSNRDIHARLASCSALRDQGLSTLPSSIGLERLTNPFVRAGSAGELAKRRGAKDSFRA
jgi:hydroxyacylglutathione hydrolase